MADKSSNSPENRDAPESDKLRSRFFGSRNALRSPNDALQPDVPPPPPARQLRKRKRSLLGSISAFFTFLVVAAIAAVAVVAIGSQRLQTPGPLKADTIVVIPPRTDVPDIIARLETEGVIDSQILMNAALLAEGTRSKLKAGEYMFKQSASMQEVIDTLVSGHSVLHSFTIPEGWTSEQIVSRLREQDLLESEIKDIPKEGSLMPDTYKFARGETRDKQVQKMMDAQKKVLAEVWARRAADLPLKTSFELLTLASIVERETAKADERPRVAGVYINRLVKNMQLQSDPTIVYGLVGGKGSLGHPITKDELIKPTPYNTYQIRGLPPGPIGNPGRAAMEAVANPSRTQELFFVADGTGGHAFAETLDQHNKNVARWRLIEQDAKDKLAPDAQKGVTPVKPPDQKGELDWPSVTAGVKPVAFAETAPPPAQRALAANAIASLVAPPAPVLKPAVQGRLAQFPMAAAMRPSNDRPSPAPDLFSVNPDGAAPDLFADGEAQPDLTAYPVSASRRMDQKKNAARFGLAAAPDVLPQQAGLADPSPAPAANGQQQARARAFDASEGTPLDPLKNKTFDLNSAKTVPSFK